MSTCEYDWCENTFPPVDHQDEGYHFRKVRMRRGEYEADFIFGIQEGTAYIYHCGNSDIEYEIRAHEPDLIPDMIAALEEVQQVWVEFRSRYETVTDIMRRAKATGEPVSALLSRNIEATAALAERDV